MKICERINLGGTGVMHLCRDEAGKQYLFKPAVRKNTYIYEPFRADIQVAASKLQKLISPRTAVNCEFAEVGGMKGAIQERVDLDKEKTESLKDYYFNNGTLDEHIARQFMREFVVDYCLVNYDSNYRNFIVDKQGNLRGVDKEQSLRYLNDSQTRCDYKLDKYHPNAKYGAEPPIYGKIFSDIEKGILPIDILKELHNGIKIEGC